MSLRRVCVFCGSSAGFHEEYRTAATRLADALVARHIGVVFGGGKVGLMGVCTEVDCRFREDLRSLYMRTRYLAGALGLVVFSMRLAALDPTLLIFHGGQLTQSIRVYPGDNSGSGFLWSPSRGCINFEMKGCTIPKNLEGRAYIDVAIFWGRVDDPENVKPEAASQHARVYLPTRDEPAVVVITSPLMSHPTPVPVPSSLSDFVAGWRLTAEDMAAAKRLGVPIF
jgi:hypothetical protein